MKTSQFLSDLQITRNNGQLFLRWQEHDLPEDARLSIRRSIQPLNAGNIGNAVILADMLNPGSAADWWLDPESFVTERDDSVRAEEIFAGNVADTGTRKNHPLKSFFPDDDVTGNPACSGLHVHTPEESGEFFFAVCLHRGTSGEVYSFLASEHALHVEPGRINIFRISGDISTGETAGLPVIVDLHGREGGIGVDARGNALGTHLIFSDNTVAWREGIPFKFSITVTDTLDERKSPEKFIRLSIYDRVWTGRRLTPEESGDVRDYVPAINTFFLGYHTNIARSNSAPWIWDNYTEKLVLKIIDLVIENLQADPERIYLAGGSMGGTGAVQLALHYPEKFAAAVAWVPVYSYTWEKTPGFPELSPSIERMRCSIGQFSPADKVISPDGKNLLEYGDGALRISHREIDFPPLFATNGRCDLSIPWVNNPPFFRAANESCQAFRVIWNNGGHAMTREVPEVVTLAELLKYRRNEPFAAFSNSSDNRQYGNGDPADGNLYGWINRGLTAGCIREDAACIEVEITAGHEDMLFPVKCDVTIRRRRHFKFAPGTPLAAHAGQEQYSARIDDDGVLTVKGVCFPRPGTIRLICRPDAG